MKYCGIGGKSESGSVDNSVAESALNRVDKMKREHGQVRQAVAALSTRVQALETAPAPVCSCPVSLPQTQAPQVAAAAPTHTTTIIREQADLSSINVQLQELADHVDQIDEDLAEIEKEASSAPAPVDLGPLHAEIAKLNRRISIGAAVGSLLLIISFIL